MNNPNISQITTDQLEAKLKHGDKLKIIDVRNPDEYENGHIEYSENIPLITIDQYKKNPNEDVYVICQSGKRSQKASEILSNKGYHVTNVEGGMNSWNGKIVK